MPERARGFVVKYEDACVGSVGSPRSLKSPKLLESKGFWRCDKSGEGLAQFSTAAAGIEHHSVVERFFVACGGA